MQETISEAVAQKAVRLIAEERITWVKGHVYQVRGDSDIYTVHVSYAEEASGRCDCKGNANGRVCSHLVAACAYNLAHPVPKFKSTDPFGGLGI